MPPINFVTAERIAFGRGLLDALGEECAKLGASALIVTNADRAGTQGLMPKLEKLFADASVSNELLWLTGEPQIEDVDRGLEAARAAGSEVVIGLGGGSAIDAAKAVAGLLANGGSCLDYMEVIGEGKPITKRSTPFIAVPTTAGTGAEVTRNAVIGCAEKKYKASIRSPLLLPRLALVDPDLGAGVRPQVTARAGMDALTQCIESYTSTGAHALTDGLALEGIMRAGRSLRRVVADGSDLDAREDMAMAALISGITLTNAGLGAVHGLAAPAGARFPVPHGAVCAALLPPVMAANVAALREERTDHPMLSRYAEIGRILTGQRDLPDEKAVHAGIVEAEKLVNDLGIPGLRDFGFTEAVLPEVAALGKRASSMRYNPVALSEEALVAVLAEAM